MPHGPDYGTGQGVPMNGTLALLVIDGVLIGHQRGLTINENNDTVDYSSKDARPQRVGYGRYSSSVSLQSLYVPGSSGYEALKTASRNGTMVQLIRREKGSNYEQTHAKIDSISGDFPDQGESVLSVDLTIDGGWEAVAP